MDIKTILTRAAIIIGVGCALFLWGWAAGYNSQPKARPLVKRYEVVTNYATNYGYKTNYIRVDIPEIKTLTKITDLTNVRFMEITALATNWVEATNWQTLTVTQVIQIFEDYAGYSESPFVFWQSNENLEVSLWKRAASYQIKPWMSAPRWSVMAFFPTGIAVEYAPIDSGPLSGVIVGGMLVFPSFMAGLGGSNFGAAVGIGWRW